MQLVRLDVMLVKTGFFRARGLSEKLKKDITSVCFKLFFGFFCELVKTSFFMRLVKTLGQNLLNSAQVFLPFFKSWFSRYITSSLTVNMHISRFRVHILMMNCYKNH